MAAKVRATLDASPEKVGAKIRNAQIDKVPYMLVVGPREAEAGQVSVRHARRGDLGAQDAAAFLADLAAEIRERRL